MHFDQAELAAYVGVRRDVRDLYHVDQLVQLLGNLFQRVIATLNDDCHPGYPWVLRNPYGQAVNVVASPREESRNPCKYTWAVLYQNSNGMAHAGHLQKKKEKPLALAQAARGERFAFAVPPCFASLSRVRP